MLIKYNLVMPLFGAARSESCKSEHRKHLSKAHTVDYEDREGIQELVDNEHRIDLFQCRTADGSLKHAEFHSIFNLLNQEENMNILEQDQAEIDEGEGDQMEDDQLQHKIDQINRELQEESDYQEIQQEEEEQESHEEHESQDENEEQENPSSVYQSKQTTKQNDKEEIEDDDNQSLQFGKITFLAFFINNT